MIRKINRIIQNWMREKRLFLGRVIWDNKKKSEKFNEKNIIENNNIKSILFLRYDGKIGDTVISTLMFREIKKRYPSIKIGIVTRKNNYEIIKDNPYIEKKYIYEKSLRKILKLAKKIKADKYDLLIDFSEMLRVKQMMFVNLCSCRFNLGYKKASWKLFDGSFDEPKGNYHITKLYQNVLKDLGIVNIDLSYELFFLDETKQKIDKLIDKYNGKKIYILNPFAASKHRELNEINIHKIIDIILQKKDRVVFLIGEKGNSERIKNITKHYDGKVFYPALDSIMETAYLIKKSQFVISPDTSIVHISACFKKNMIAIYRLDFHEENRKNSNLWAPNYPEALQVYSIDNSVKFGEEPDINKFDLGEIDNIINKSDKGEKNDF